MKREINIREYQKILLDIMIYFDKVCKELNIDYCLCAGTLLGAVRHKGFIPWDEDVDVFILKKDFEKIKNYINNDKENKVKIYKYLLIILCLIFYFYGLIIDYLLLENHFWIF